MSAARNVMQLVERKMDILDAEERVEQYMAQGQTTEDFFTRADRTELIKQGIQSEQILRDLADIKGTAKETVQRNTDYLGAHEKRLRDLEDSRLQLQTQIKTSWWWIVLLSAGASAAVNFLIKLISK